LLTLSAIILQIEVINTMQLLTAKPVIYLVNLSETDYERRKNKWLPKIKEWIDTNNPGDQLIPFSVSLEERLMTEGGIENTTAGLSKIIKSGYDNLSLCRYFTCGEAEVRAWTIQKGTKAPQAAGVIHSDFEKKFICGNKFNYDDLKELGTEAAVQAAGKISQIGKTYEMVDGDIVVWKAGG
jgi:obg-like ATPase 1